MPKAWRPRPKRTIFVSLPPVIERFDSGTAFPARGILPPIYRLSTQSTGFERMRMDGIHEGIVKTANGYGASNLLDKHEVAGSIPGRPRMKMNRLCPFLYAFTFSATAAVTAGCGPSHPTAPALLRAPPLSASRVSQQARNGDLIYVGTPTYVVDVLSYPDGALVSKIFDYNLRGQGALCSDASGNVFFRRSRQIPQPSS
jgi:hypothetical protein